LGWEIHYIGSREGIEKELLSGTGLPYHAITTGKLRRYLSVKNFTDPFRVLGGLFQSILLLKKIRPRIVFAKGGFVSVPVVIAAWFNRIPVILHESDITPGLANRICSPFADLVCVSFPEAEKYFPAGKTVLTGNPIRRFLLSGSKTKALELCGFSPNRPVLLVTGGSLGAARINSLIRAILPQLKDFQVIHICGRGHLDPALEKTEGYRQFEFIGPELPHILAAADLCVSRAGANFLFELLALKKPALLIPLPKTASRGDQILNARSFAAQGFSMVLPEEEATEETLLERIRLIYRNRRQFVAKMRDYAGKDALSEVIKLITAKADSRSRVPRGPR
jgi:UDP-N-acetylglucosamine--N-acetylmuramyl-(pentapeptide) pyrophosphoryl-undecaprenol N-acetylglucosamine transferase